MKRILYILSAFILSISLSSCSLLNVLTSNNDVSLENSKNFYDKANECKALLDLVATDVCAAWKDASQDNTLSTEDVNNAIENAKKAHSENITKINELDKEIVDLFAKAKDEIIDFSVEYVLKQVMTTYSEYKDAILNANEALNPNGYYDISSSKSSLDRALQDLFAEL